MDRLKALFLDEKTDISDKLYVAFSGAIIVLVLTIFFVNVLTTSAIDVTVISWVAFFVQSLVLSFAVYKNSFYLPKIISCILINFFALPFIFLNGYLFFGAVPIWMIVGFAFTGLVMSGTTRVVVVVIQNIINLLVFVISFSLDWNEITQRYNIGLRLVDHWLAFFAGGVALFAMASFNIWLSSMEEKTVRKQRDNIAALYRNQNTFFSSMSHEIRTPINTIMGLNEVNIALAPADDILDYSTEIKLAGNKLLTLINDILDLSKLQSGKMEIVGDNYNLSEMISLITDDVWKESYDKGVKFNIAVAPDIPDELFGDEIRIRQIVRNLLTNSINSPETSNITLHVRFREIGPDEIELVFEVEDTGRGIKRENLPHVFDVFKISEDETEDIEGTGLELPIAKALSDVMGAKISVNSIYGKGSTYTFSVAQKCVTAKEEVKTKDSENRTDLDAEDVVVAPVVEKTRILVVDDDGMNLNVFKKMFEEVFTDIDTATNGEDAIALCKNNDYDIVFIDHLMPGMDGIETLAGIRKVRGEVTAVALTANIVSDMRVLYIESGFTDYLAKPIDKEYALRTIYKLLPQEKRASVPNLTENTGSISVIEEQKRAAIAITTDSVSDIPEEFLKEHNIRMIPFYINTSEGRRYRDREEISSDSLISFINNDDRYASSEAPSEKEYETFFGDVLKNADSIIHVSAAKNNSPAYANALAATKSFSNVEVVDSGHVCAGLGVLAIYAAKLAAGGADANEIKEMICTSKDRIVFDFVVDETRNLAATGKISMRFHRLCSFLNIHPVMTLKKSRMVVRRIKIGNINRIRNQYFNNICKRKDIAKDFFILLHSGLDAEILEPIQKEIKECIPTEIFTTALAGPAVVSNSSRGAFGICYRKKV